MKLKLSIIIPTLNEAINLSRLLKRLLEIPKEYSLQIIVVDGGSDDKTTQIASDFGVELIESLKQSRAIQMNLGAEKANGDYLYFVHADTLPPPTYITDIYKSIEQGHTIGCFRYKFDSSKQLLKLNAFFTRYSFLWCRGGDQSLYIPKSTFFEMGKFDESCLIMEDFNFLCRLKERSSLHIIQKDFLVSARKYEENGYLRVQLANFIVFNMFRFGFPQEKLLNTYSYLLKYRY